MAICTKPIRTDEERRQARETREAEEAYARASAPKN